MKKLYLFLVVVILVSLIGGACLSHYTRELHNQENTRLHELMQSLSSEDLDRILKIYKNSSRTAQNKILSGPFWEEYFIKEHLKKNDSICAVLHEKIAILNNIDYWTRNIFSCSIFAFFVVIMLHFTFFTYQKFRYGITTKQQRLGLVILTISTPFFLLSTFLFDSNSFRPIRGLQQGDAWAWVFLTASIIFCLGVGFILPVFQNIFDLGKKIHSWVNKGD